MISIYIIIQKEHFSYLSRNLRVRVCSNNIWSLVTVAFKQFPKRTYSFTDKHVFFLGKLFTIVLQTNLKLYIFKISIQIISIVSLITKPNVTINQQLNQEHKPTIECNCEWSIEKFKISVYCTKSFNGYTDLRQQRIQI